MKLTNHEIIQSTNLGNEQDMSGGTSTYYFITPDIELLLSIYN